MTARKYLLDGPDWPESLGVPSVLSQAIRANTSAGTLATLLLRDDSARESGEAHLSDWARHGMLLALETCITEIDRCLEHMAEQHEAREAGGAQ